MSTLLLLPVLQFSSLALCRVLHVGHTCRMAAEWTGLVWFRLLSQAFSDSFIRSYFPCFICLCCRAVWRCKQGKADTASACLRDPCPHGLELNDRRLELDDRHVMYEASCHPSRHDERMQFSRHQRRHMSNCYSAKQADHEEAEVQEAGAGAGAAAGEAVLIRRLLSGCETAVLQQWKCVHKVHLQNPVSQSCLRGS